MKKLLSVMVPGLSFTLNQIVRRSRLPRPKVITLLARFIRFGLVRWQYRDQQFVFEASE